jgi:membrane protein DedA with SNARE-associated domain
MQEWLLQMFTEHQYLVYAAIVLICFVEGPILTVLSGILIKVGGLPLIPLYLALMLGDLIGDVVWYWIGRKAGHPFVRRFGKYFSIEEAEIAAVTKIFHKYHEWILIISKVTMGLGFAIVTLFTAGMVRISFKKYFIINAIGQIVWTGLLLGIGYLFGEWYTALDNIFGKISLAAGVILVGAGLLGYGRFMKKRMTAHIN